MYTVQAAFLTYLHYLQGSRVQSICLFHDHLLSLIKDVVSDILLVGGEIVLESSHVCPLVLPRWHLKRAGCQVPGQTHTTHLPQMNTFSDIRKTMIYVVTCTYNVLCYCINAHIFLHIIYRITETFRGRKLSQIGGKMGFNGENFCGLLARTTYCPPSL